MAGGHRCGVERAGTVEQVRELQIAVAMDARDRRAAGGVLVDEVADDVRVERGLVVDHVVGDAELRGGAVGRRADLDGTAATEARRTLALVVELHR